MLKYKFFSARALLSFALLLVFFASGSVFAFSQRSEAPAVAGEFYDQGNPFPSKGVNCTWYAYGRAYELLGEKPKLSLGDAKTWYDYNQREQCYPYGKEPKPGAIACWNGGGTGHVAVVEGIEDGKLLMSESNYGLAGKGSKYAFPFRYGPLEVSYYPGFQGYIYLLDQQTNTEQGAEEKHVQPLYRDVKPEEDYFQAVEALSKANIIQGTGEGMFSPQTVVNRGMLVTVLHRLAGSPDVQQEAGFQDVAKGSWYEPGVNWAKQQELVKGYSDVAFAPMDQLTRQQILAVLYRYAKGQAGDHGLLSQYQDGDQVATYAQDAYAWALSKGIVKPKGDRLAANQGVSRGELAFMLAATVGEEQLAELIAQQAANPKPLPKVEVTVEPVQPVQPAPVKIEYLTLEQLMVKYRALDYTKPVVEPPMLPKRPASLPVITAVDPKNPGKQLPKPTVPNAALYKADNEICTNRDFAVLFYNRYGKGWFQVPEVLYYANKISSDQRFYVMVPTLRDTDPSDFDQRALYFTYNWVSRSLKTATHMSVVGPEVPFTRVNLGAFIGKIEGPSSKGLSWSRPPSFAYSMYDKETTMALAKEELGMPRDDMDAMIEQVGKWYENVHPLQRLPKEKERNANTLTFRIGHWGLKHDMGIELEMNKLAEPMTIGEVKGYLERMEKNKKFSDILKHLKDNLQNHIVYDRISHNLR